MELWTFAVRYIADQWNDSPHKDLNMQTPNEVFANVKPTLKENEQRKRYNRLPYYHTFGCPVYVLNSKHQDGKKTHKWKPKARVGIFLGHSRTHASTVSWVLNPKNRPHKSTVSCNI